MVVVDGHGATRRGGWLRVERKSVNPAEPRPAAAAGAAAAAELLPLPLLMLVVLLLLPGSGENAKTAGFGGARSG